MNESDRQRFAQVMAGVAELYGKKLSTPLLEIYWRSLKTQELSAIEDAFGKHALNPDGGQFMPKPADVMRYIDGGGAGKSGLAWTNVVKAIRHHGGWSSVAFDDPITHAVITDMGGWVTLCETLQDPTASNTNFPFVAREFERRYRAYLDTGLRGEVPKSLPGRADSPNTRLGYHPEKPKLIDAPKPNKVGGEWEIAKLIAKETA